MKIINFAEQDTIVNRFMSELRDVNVQQDRMRFRRNLERIGEVMAYEISKTLAYHPQTVETPLGKATGSRKSRTGHHPACRHSLPPRIPTLHGQCRERLCIGIQAI